MIRNLTILLVFLVSLPIISSAEPGRKDKTDQGESFTLNGTIENYDTGIVYMQRAVNFQIQPYDTVNVVDGKFQFTGSVEHPELFYFQVDNRKKKLVQVFIENSEITLQFNLERFNEAFVSGSASHDKFMEFQLADMNFQQEQGQIQNAYNQAVGQGNNQLANQYRGAFAAKGQERLNHMQNFISNNQESPVSGWIIARYLRDENLFPYVKAELDSLRKYQPEYKYTILVENWVAKVGRLSIGAVPPEIVLNDTSGVEHNLEEFKGKVLLIDFWASWCGPCRRANPSVVALYNTYKDQGFEILGVSLDKNAGAWKKAIIADKLTWTHVSDLKGWGCVPCKEYKVSSIPNTYLLDQDGKIVAKGLKGAALEAKVKELLAAEN